MVNRCSMTGAIVDGPGDAIWDDGEWISWDWINSEIGKNELREQFPDADIEVVEIFNHLASIAEDYFRLTKRHLQIYGELGELFAEIVLGIKRHKPGTPGSDGRVGNDWVEVKTISPKKASNIITVKRAGNFNRLVVVKIDEQFNFEIRTIERKKLGKGTGKYARVSWSKMDPIKAKLTDN